MSALLLDREEREVVVFHVWKSLKYETRVMLSIGLILIGFGFQLFQLKVIPGIFLILLGNLFLLVKGYNNRVDTGGYDPNADWQKVEGDKLQEILQLNEKSKQWDRSAIDITSGPGVGTLIILLVALVVPYFLVPWQWLEILNIVVFDAAVMLLPFWVTGIKRILTTPKLIAKIELYQTLLKKMDAALQEHKIGYYMLMKGKEAKIPNDIKIKVAVKNQPEGILGLYAQVSTNSVNGTDFPYFYVVLVSKKEFDLYKYHRSLRVSRPIIKEFDTKRDVNVLILRQHTTKTSGYHTKPPVIEKIFKEGLALAERVARG
jgi:hypothetical protein